MLYSRTTNIPKGQHITVLAFAYQALISLTLILSTYNSFAQQFPKELKHIIFSYAFTGTSPVLNTLVRHNSVGINNTLADSIVQAYSSLKHQHHLADHTVLSFNEFCTKFIRLFATNHYPALHDHLLAALKRLYEAQPVLVTALCLRNPAELRALNKTLLAARLQAFFPHSPVFRDIILTTPEHYAAAQKLHTQLQDDLITLETCLELLSQQHSYMYALHKHMIDDVYQCEHNSSVILALGSIVLLCYGAFRSLNPEARAYWITSTHGAVIAAHVFWRSFRTHRANQRTPMLGRTLNPYELIKVSGIFYAVGLGLLAAGQNAVGVWVLTLGTVFTLIEAMRQQFKAEFPRSSFPFYTNVPSPSMSHWNKHLGDHYTELVQNVKDHRRKLKKISAALSEKLESH